MTVTPWASPVPELDTVTVKPIGSPAFTDTASAVLTMVTWAGRQVIFASLDPDPSLVVVTMAVLSYTVHSLAEVVAVICTLKLPPAARSVGPQANVWGAAALTEHRPALDWVSMDQVTPDPEPAGSGSLTVTPWASPVPELDTVTVKPIGSPAFTDTASAVLTMLTWAGRQVIFASLDPDPSLVFFTMAVFSHPVLPPSPTRRSSDLLKLPPAARSVGPQANVWGAAALTEH